MKIKNTLHKKLARIILGTLAICFCLLLYLNSIISDKYFNEISIKDYENTIDNFLAQNKLNFALNNGAMVLNGLKQLTINKSIVYAVIFEPQENTFSVNTSSNSAFDEAVIKKWDGKNSGKIDVNNKTYYFVAKKFYFAGKNKDMYLYLLGNNDNLKQFLNLQLVITNLIFGIAFLILAATCFYLVRIYLLPLNTLTNKVLNLKHEEQETINLEYTKDDEIGAIATAMNLVLNKIYSLQCKIKESEKMAAIGQTTSMLAHDVRKPFTQVKSIINMFDDLKNDPNALAQAKQDVEKAIKNVEAMISDIMDYSREVKLETAAKNLNTILNFSIRQTALGYKNANINFKYNLDNRYMPLVDDERIARVFSNIIGNAIEAITIIGKKDQGTVTLNSEDVVVRGTRYLEIAIANDGPLFRQEDVGKLFDSFFTKGKSKGTGLGLASVQKIINLHGGKIWAENLPSNDGVQFVMRLPSSDQIQNEDADVKLANSIQESLLHSSTVKGEATKQMLSLPQNLKVLLLEDEALYRAGVKNIVSSNPELQKNVILYDAHTVEDALKLVEQEKIEHAIVDIDLGQMKNGFDFLAEAKHKFPKLKSMIHSNRCVKEDHDLARELGAIKFAPKPLDLDGLLFLLNVKDSGDSSATMYEYVYIDDDPLFRKGWERYAKKANAKLLTLANTPDFEKYKNLIDKDKTMIFIDSQLADGEAPGEDFAIVLHNEGYKNISMATGYDKSKFAHLPWLKVSGKESPWEDDD